MAMDVMVESPRVRYSRRYIEADYDYQTTSVRAEDDRYTVIPQVSRLVIRTERRVPKIGVMFAGWGSATGSTLTAAILANKLNLSWSADGIVHHPNYLGSVLMSSTTCLGTSPDGRRVFDPLHKLLPMANPNDLVLDGWDVSSADLGTAAEKAQILHPQLLEQLRPHMCKLKPKPSPYSANFTTSENQTTRLDNILRGTKRDHMEQVRKDIREFRAEKDLDRVILVWAAETERSSNVMSGFNDTAYNLMRSLRADNSEISPSTLFCVASILEGCPFLNCSSQNTFVPGCIELATQNNVFIAGDDLEIASAKLKSEVLDFLTSFGLKVVSVEPSANKESLEDVNEIVTESLLGVENHVEIHGSLKDSSQSVSVMLDLILLTELCQRITFRTHDESAFSKFHPILSILSYFFKTPVQAEGHVPIHSVDQKRSSIENFLRACVGLPPQNHLVLENRLKNPHILQRREEHSLIEVSSYCKSREIIDHGGHICDFSFASETVLSRT